MPLHACVPPKGGRAHASFSFAKEITQMHFGMVGLGCLRSRANDPFTEKVLAALRNQFGGHPVKHAERRERDAA